MDGCVGGCGPPEVNDNDGDGDDLDGDGEELDGDGAASDAACCFYTPARWAAAPRSHWGSR